MCVIPGSLIGRALPLKDRGAGFESRSWILLLQLTHPDSGCRVQSTLLIMNSHYSELCDIANHCPCPWLLPGIEKSKISLLFHIHYKCVMRAILTSHGGEYNLNFLASSALLMAFCYAMFPCLTSILWRCLCACFPPRFTIAR